MSKQHVTGVRLRNCHIAWSVLKQKKNEAEVESQGQTDLEVEGEIVDLKAPETATALKKACAAMKGEIGVALPSENVLLRVVELPTVEEDELEGMVDLQVDKFSPFPAEQMAISYEILLQKESSTRVLIAAVRDELVDDLGAAFSGAGHVPHGVDVEILGWWELLTTHEAVPRQGRQALLLVDEGGAELVVVQDGIPVVFRALGAHTGLSAAEEINEIAEEISYTLTSLETEWGSAGATNMAVWTMGEAPPMLITTLGTECAVQIETHKLNDLPPLSEGLARRFAAKSGTRVNLAPDAWQEGEKSRHARKILTAISVVFFALWFSAIAVFFVGLKMQQNRWTELQASFAELEEEAAEVEALQDKVKTLKEYADRSRSSLECLREVSVAQPDGVDMGRFSYKKARTVNISGSAQNETPIYDFISALEKSDMFVEVKTEKISSNRRRGKSVTEFKVTAKLPGDES